MKPVEAKSPGTDPSMFDIESVFDAAKALNRVADSARACGWEIEIDGADYIVVTVKRRWGGDAR